MARKQFPRVFKILSLLAVLLLSGCKAVVLDPKGQIGMDERSLIITATLLMLIVVIPVIVMTVWFAWRYRASNKNATYDPEFSHSTAIEVVVWLVPCLIIAVLAVITWKTSHSLDPYKPIASKDKTMTIDVVSLDWKWLFIYPDQHIATVNEVHFPKNVPVRFKLTSDTVMNGFFIPQLGTQIMTMAGMKTEVHLIANHNGTYFGLSTVLSGNGFSGMEFNAVVTSKQDFDKWVEGVKQGSKRLDMPTYDALAKPSKNNPVTEYSWVKPNLFNDIISKYQYPQTVGNAKPMKNMNSGS